MHHFGQEWTKCSSSIESRSGESASKLAELGVNLESDQDKTRNDAENACDDDDDTEKNILALTVQAKEVAERRIQAE